MVGVAGPGEGDGGRRQPRAFARGCSLSFLILQRRLRMFFKLSPRGRGVKTLGDARARTSEIEHPLEERPVCSHLKPSVSHHILGVIPPTECLLLLKLEYLGPTLSNPMGRQAKTKPKPCISEWVEFSPLLFTLEAGREESCFRTGGNREE